MHFVLTGNANMGRRPVQRADLIQRMAGLGEIVQSSVRGDTHVLVASRTDTTKAAEARRRMIPVWTYEQLHTYLLAREHGCSDSRAIDIVTGREAMPEGGRPTPSRIPTPRQADAEGPTSLNPGSTMRIGDYTIRAQRVGSDMRYDVCDSRNVMMGQYRFLIAARRYVTRLIAEEANAKAKEPVPTVEPHQAPHVLSNGKRAIDL